MERPLILVHAEHNPVIMDQVIEEIGPRVQQLVVVLSASALNRYNLRAGRLFGNPRGKERYRIIDTIGSRVVYKDLLIDKIITEDVDTLLEAWNLMGVAELSPIERILEQIKRWLEPFLGKAIVAALVVWLMKKLGR